jgi:hypothetical protein
MKYYKFSIILKVHGQLLTSESENYFILIPKIIEKAATKNCKIAFTQLCMIHFLTIYSPIHIIIIRNIKKYGNSK